MEAPIGFTGDPEMYNHGRAGAKPPTSSSSRRNTKQRVQRNATDGRESSYGSLRSELRRQKGFMVVNARSEKTNPTNAIINSSSKHFRSIKDKLKEYRESAYYIRDRYGPSTDDGAIFSVDGSGDTITTAHETLESSLSLDVTFDEHPNESLGELTVDDQGANIEVYETPSAEIQYLEGFNLSAASLISASTSFGNSRTTEKIHRETADPRKPEVKQQVIVPEHHQQRQDVEAIKISNDDVRDYSIYASASIESSSSDLSGKLCRERSLLDVFSHSADEEDDDEVTRRDELEEMRAQTHEFQQQRGKSTNQPVWQMKPATLEMPLQHSRSRSRKAARGRLSMSRRKSRSPPSCRSLGSAATNNCVDQFLDAAERFEKKKQMEDDCSTMTETSVWESMTTSMACLADQFSCRW